jgi:hypothetical protein
MKRTPIRKVSKKRAKANAEYSKRRKSFLEAHPICQWWLKENGWVESGTNNVHLYSKNCITRNTWHLQDMGAPLSTEIHHMKKPKATYLNDESTWMAVSREGHEWIENHKNLAREKGYLSNI